MTFAVRQLTEDDVAAYCDIRFEGLRTDPAGFGATLEEDRAVTEAEWRQRIARNKTFGVFDAELLAGVATYVVEGGAKVSHRAHLVGVYVRPEARGTSAATMVVQAAIDSARERVSFLYLQVIQKNPRAVRFYERLGFTIYAKDPGGLMVDGTIYEDYLMMLRLK